MNFFVLPMQVHLMRQMCLAGLAAGAVYDGLRPLRRRTVSCVLADGFYGLLCWLMVTFVLAKCGESSVRLVHLVFFLLGAGLYALGIRTLLLFCFRFITGRKNLLPWRK